MVVAPDRYEGCGVAETRYELEAEAVDVEAVCFRYVMDAQMDVAQLRVSHAVPIRVVEIEGMAHAVVRNPIQVTAAPAQPDQGVRKLRFRSCSVSCRVPS
jgi:hypothetical protein